MRAGARFAAGALALLGLLACRGPNDVGARARPTKRRGDPPAAEVPPRALGVTLIGTGTPVPDPRRAGPCTAITRDRRAILVDVGANVLRRLEEASVEQPALAPSRVRHVLLTHLHSDHTSGLDELLLGGWVVGRDAPLEIYGPPGTRALVEHLREAWALDRAVRSEGLERSDPRGSEAVVHELEAGAPIEIEGMRVTAIEVRHGSWEHAFGYRVEAAGARVVVSGDTAPSEAIVEACDGCDVLVHEVYSASGWAGGDEGFRAYHAAFHTSSTELGPLARRARPRLLVLTHALFFGQSPATILEEVRRGTDGEVVLGEDLARY